MEGMRQREEARCHSVIVTENKMLDFVHSKYKLNLFIDSYLEFNEFIIYIVICVLLYSQISTSDLFSNCSIKIKMRYNEETQSCTYIHLATAIRAIHVTADSTQNLVNHAWHVRLRFSICFKTHFFPLFSISFKSIVSIVIPLGK